MRSILNDTLLAACNHHTCHVVLAPLSQALYNVACAIGGINCHNDLPTAKICPHTYRPNAAALLTMYTGHPPLHNKWEPYIQHTDPRMPTDKQRTRAQHILLRHYNSQGTRCVHARSFHNTILCLRSALHGSQMLRWCPSSGMHTYYRPTAGGRHYYDRTF